ncbi:hypothetical protein P9112_011897 [Eukaryota sp. TZLM1-RC]
MSHTRLNAQTIALLNKIASERRATLSSSSSRANNRPPSAAYSHRTSSLRPTTTDIPSRTRSRSVGSRAASSSSLEHLPPSHTSSTMGVTGRPVGVSTCINFADDSFHSNRPSTAPKDSLPSSLSARRSADGIVFAESSKYPDVPIVCRTSSAKSQCPERINLDKRRLEVFPIVEGEPLLKLVNLQHNSIPKIENLSFIQNIIFLDLYNNKLTEISNLEDVVNLKVLMLGRNQIKEIKGLEMLTKLDVLDLHSNLIEEISGLDCQKDLRVLNLAGNVIKVVENLENCQSLTELNLRRNKIATVSSVDSIPSLCRLFLSSNSISSFNSIYSVFQCKSLVDLSLDANPICEAFGADYRFFVLNQLPQLKNLDLQAVSYSDIQSAARHDFELTFDPQHDIKMDETDTGTSVTEAEIFSNESESDDELIGVEVVDSVINITSSQGISTLSEYFTKILNQSNRTIQFNGIKLTDFKDSCINEVINRPNLLDTVVFNDCAVDKFSILQTYSFLNNVSNVCIVGKDLLTNSSLLRPFFALYYPNIKTVNNEVVKESDKKKALGFFQSQQKTNQMTLSDRPKVEKYRHQISILVDDVVKKSLVTMEKLNQLDSLLDEFLTVEVNEIQTDIQRPVERMIGSLVDAEQRGNFAIPNGVSNLGKR